MTTTTAADFFHQSMEVTVYDDRHRTFRGKVTVPLDDLVPSGTKE